jgi:hypothetical protein
MDFFGLVRITVTWLPRAGAALWADEPGTEAAPASEPEPAAGTSAGQPPRGEPAVPGAEVPPLVAGLWTVVADDAAPAGTPPGPRKDVVQSLISLADDVAELAGQAAESEAADNLLRLTQWRVDQVLADCGVRVVADEGRVDPARHEVAGTRPAGADGTAGWIAATVRRGYRRDGELIRPQQVVAYTSELPSGARGGNDDARED